jgi:hypothetical protein
VLIAGIFGGFLAKGLDPEYRSGGLRKGKERRGELQTLEKVERASCTSGASLRASCLDFPSGCAFGVRL